jgi:U3 small nucleolar RNA-associated protein 15
MEEIGRRGGLRAALAGRDDTALAPVLKFITRHVSQPRWGLATLNPQPQILNPKP